MFKLLKKNMKNKNNLLQKFKIIIQNQKLTHLYLIESDNDEDKTTFMFKLVYDFLKNQNSAGFLNKELIQTFSYPNFYYLDANGINITKEQILEMQLYFSKTSLVQERKVYVIDGIENISYKTSNSLLYFLENPINENTLGILFTKDHHLVLSTILSRAQFFYLDDEYNYDLVAKKYLNKLDKTLISVLQKNRKIEIDNYFHDLKEFFLFFLNILPEKKVVSKLYFHSRFLIQNKYFVNDFLCLLISFFLDLCYKKNNFVYIWPNFLLEHLFYKKLSMQLTLDILNFLIKIEQDQNILEHRFCFIGLLIKIEKKIESYKKV